MPTTRSLIKQKKLKAGPEMMVSKKITVMINSRVETLKDIADHVFDSSEASQNFINTPIAEFNNKTLIDLAASGDEGLEKAVEHIKQVDTGLEL